MIGGRLRVAPPIGLTYTRPVLRRARLSGIVSGVASPRETSVQNKQRAEDTEWSRYSRAFASREGGRDEYGDAAPDAAAPPAALTSSSLSKQPLQEVPAPASRVTQQAPDPDFED